MLNGPQPRLTLRQRRLLLEMINGKRVRWLAGRSRPCLDGRPFARRTLTRLIELGLVQCVATEHVAGMHLANVYGPTPHALQLYQRRAPARVDDPHCDGAAAR